MILHTVLLQPVAVTNRSQEYPVQLVFKLVKNVLSVYLLIKNLKKIVKKILHTVLKNDQIAKIFFCLVSKVLHDAV